MASAPEGTRNHALNVAAFNMGSLIEANAIDETTVVDSLTVAARAAGLDDFEIEGTIRSGIAGGRAQGPRAVPEGSSIQGPGKRGPESQPGGGNRPSGRSLTLKSYAGVEDKVPEWAWIYNGAGRIQLGALTIFSGKSGAGKSTAARWFAAQLTRGKLDGFWNGQPQNVALITPEESASYAVKPSLRAAGADMSRVFYPEVTFDGEASSLIGREDEAALTEALMEANIRVLIVDPIMSTMGGGVDINRNNEVRAYLEPYSRIAETIGGIVIGVAHLTKSATDVMSGTTGSAAFVEVARCVFGFVKDPSSADERVMSQPKNSAGKEDLAIVYKLDATWIQTDDGRSADMPVFKMLRDSLVTVEDMLSDEGGAHTATQAAVAWLHDYLMINGPTPRKEIKTESAKEGFSESTIQRAASRLKVNMENRSIDGAPRTSVWLLSEQRISNQVNPRA